MEGGGGLGLRAIAGSLDVATSSSQNPPNFTFDGLAIAKGRSGVGFGIYGASGVGFNGTLASPSVRDMLNLPLQNAESE